MATAQGGGASIIVDGQIDGQPYTFPRPSTPRRN